MANEKLLGLIEDVNPTEIESHIEAGGLHTWCKAWRNAAKSCLPTKACDVENDVLVDHLIAEGVTIPVRCKDCKFTEGRSKYGWLWRGKWNDARDDYGYCYRGERRTDEGKAD